MRKLVCLTVVLALAVFAMTAFAAEKHWVAPKTTSGSPAHIVGPLKYDPHSLAQYKARNFLSAAMNAKIAAQQRDGAFINGTIDTVPYFNSWFITGGGHNSVYTYSMMGHSPTGGGTTGIDNAIIPIVTFLQFGGNVLYTFDPTVAVDPEGSDVSLLEQSPLYDATTTYPGPPADTGQDLDTFQRVAFRKVRSANWHTVLNTPSVPGTGFQTLIWENGDWACAGGEVPPCTSFPVFNINTISTNFQFFLTAALQPNTTYVEFVTDYLTAFIPGGGCCVLGFHSAQAGIVDPAGVSVWTWGTMIPHSPDNGFTNHFSGGFGSDVMVMTHEIGESFNDPFVQTTGTLVSPWVDGSVSFAQTNLEVGDTIEAMAPADVIYNVNLTTTGGVYTYTLQNLSTLEWFTRNPLRGGIYSWPNEATLSHFAHPPGCAAMFVCSWIYGEGSAAFYFGPPF